MRAPYKDTNLSMFDIHVISCRALRVDLTCRCLALCALFDGRHRMPHQSSGSAKNTDGNWKVFRGYIFKKKNNTKEKKKVCLFLVGGGAGQARTQNKSGVLLSISVKRVLLP